MTATEIKESIENEKQKLEKELLEENQELTEYEDFFQEYNLNDVRIYDKVDTGRFLILYLHSANPEKWSIEELKTLVQKNHTLFQNADSYIFQLVIDTARDIIEAGQADRVRNLNKESKRPFKIPFFNKEKDSQDLSELTKSSLARLKKAGYDIENLIDLMEREDQDLSRALSLVNMFKESVEIREDIVEQIAEFAEEQNMSPTDKFFKRTEDKFMNQSIKKDKVFKDLEVMQEYYKRLASNEKTKRQQTKKQLRNYQQFEELFTTAIQKSEIRNYEELVEKIANPTLRLEVLRFIYNHNLAFQQQLYSTYRAELNDATIPYKEFLSRNNLSLENIEALMTKSIEELEKMLKEISALNIQNKEQILEGSNLARISKLKELMKKGIITEEFLNKNSSLFQIEQLQYQTLTANIEFLKEKNMTPLLIGEHKELLLIPSQTLSENYQTLEEYEFSIDWTRIENASFLGASDLKGKIDKLLELGYENILETNLELLNYSKKELERLDKLKILSFPLPETKEELDFILSSKSFIMDNQELVDYSSINISNSPKKYIRPELEDSLQALEYTKRTYKVGDNIFSKRKTLRNLSTESEVTPETVFRSMVSGTTLSQAETEVVKNSLQGYNYKK